MANVTRWDPFQEMTTLRDAMTDLLADSYVRPRGLGGAPRAALDLYETENEFVGRLAAPGLTPDNFDITMHQNVLTITGHIPAEEVEGVRYHLREQYTGDFTRTIQFPSAVDADNIAASLADGILTVRVPKSEAAKPRRITVQTN